MGKFDDLYSGRYDMTDEKKLGLELDSGSISKLGTPLRVIGILMQTLGCAAGIAEAFVFAKRDERIFTFDSEKVLLLPPEPYYTAAIVIFAVIALGTLLSIIGVLLKGKKLPVTGAVIYGIVALGVTAFFSSSYYAYTDILPIINYTIEDGGDCDILYADFSAIGICQVYLIHEGKAYHVEGCSSRGGIQRHYTADYNHTEFLPAYDVAITGDGGFRYELVYTFDKKEYYGD